MRTAKRPKLTSARKMSCAKASGVRRRAYLLDSCCLSHFVSLEARMRMPMLESLECDRQAEAEVETEAETVGRL